MAGTVRVRGVVLGEGAPKICMPIVAKDLQGVRDGVAEATRLAPDLVEWRADALWGLERGTLCEALALLRAGLGERPLLFTLRRDDEGGMGCFDDAVRLELYKVALDCGCVDMIDMELASLPVLEPVLEGARAAGVPVILSSHDFAATPDVEELYDTLLRAQEVGADIAKLAVTPQSRHDVLALLVITERARGAMKVPVITMSMGVLGVVSRLGGGVFGSVLTFGAGEKASAPGQVGVRALRAALELVHPEG